MRLRDLKPGDRVLLAGDHPHAGRIGVVSQWERLVMLGDYAPRIELDGGGACFALRDSHVRRLP